MLEGEEKRLKKEEQYQNCLALMDLRRGMKENVFPLISNFRLAQMAWKALKDAYGCDEDTHGDYVSKGEPCSFEDPFEGLLEDSCEDMSYEEGMHMYDDELFLEEEDNGEFLLEEEDVEEPSVRPCETLIEKSDDDGLILEEKREEDKKCLLEKAYDGEKCLMKKAYYEDKPWQDKDGEKCLMEETYEYLMKKTPNQPFEECFMEAQNQNFEEREC